MKETFETAKAEIEIRGIVEEIEEIWKKNNSPEHSSNTTTDASGNRYMTEYENAEDEPLVNRFNYLVDLLWYLVDEFHIGAGIWYTHYYRSTEWEQYVEKASPVIEEFIACRLWELVCKEWYEDSV